MQEARGRKKEVRGQKLEDRSQKDDAWFTLRCFSSAGMVYSYLMKQHRRFHYILFNKPYGVLAQFTREAGHQSLADYGPFPPSVYAVGRLDADSEGLLLLTDDNSVKHLLTDPKFGHPRTYAVQVERIPGPGALQQLRDGVIIEGERTRPAQVRLLETDPPFPPRSTPIRFRKNVPTAWIELILREGRNRQVRKMTAHVGHPTLRLVRTAIGALTLGGLAPGEWREAAAKEVDRLRQLAHTSVYRA